MKKICKKIGRIFLAIYNFIDKTLITPITKLFMQIINFFKNNNLGFEKFLSQKQTLIIISLICAFSVFIIVDQTSNTIIDQSADIIYNQNVEAIYDVETYVVEGLPEKVDITLIGSKYHIYLAKQSPVKNVSVDLSGLKEGNHEVTLKYKQSVSSLKYKLDPATASITIYKKISETREIAYEILHRDSLDSKLYIKDVELSRSDVIIKGAAYKLESVASVKALVDVNNISKQTAGEVTLTNIPLVAYDSAGEIVDVEIVPSQIDAKLNITSPSKEVTVKVVPTGNIAFGKSISSITSNVTSVVVYGDEEAVNELEYIPVEIDVTDLESNKEYNVNIKKPNGIRDLSTKTIVVKVTLDTVATKKVEGISIETKNLDNNLKAQALSENDQTVTVIVSGSQSVLDELDAQTIRAYVDLNGYSEGEHKVPVTVVGDDLKLNYSSNTTEISIRITKK